MRATKAIPGIELAALCDVYDENLKKAQELAGGTPQTFTDYRRLLDSKDLDGVIIGTPDHWHAPMIIDSVGAGKDIYCEKPMTHKLDEGPKIIEAVGASDRIVQIGMQQRSWDLFIRGREIVGSGHLGKIALVNTWWYQNAYRGTRRMDLKAPKPPGLDWDRWMGSAPKHDYEVARFRQWRHFRASGGGGLTDLLTHLIDVVQWYTGAATPASAMALGGNYQLKHWEWPETVTAALEYPEGFSVNYSQSYITRHEGHRITFRGTLATLEINRSQLAVYEEGTRDIPSPPLPGRGHGSQPKASDSDEVDPGRDLPPHAELRRLHAQPQGTERAGHDRPRGGPGTALGEYVLSRGKKSQVGCRAKSACIRRFVGRKRFVRTPQAVGLPPFQGAFRSPPLPKSGRKGEGIS